MKANRLLPLLLVLLLGVALRTINYAASSSFWLDELFIVLNLTSRGWNQLLATPLDFHQVAPVGFLAAVKLSAELLGESEASLRLFPYLCSVTAVFLFWRVSRRFLSPGAGLAALLVFSLSPALLWYARNVKQYSGDVAVVLLLVLLALRFREGRDDTRNIVLSAVIGGIAILFSHPAVLVALVLVTALTAQRWKSKARPLPLAVLALGLAAGALVVTITSLILSPTETREFMRAGWLERGFMPIGPEALIWLPHRILLLMGLFVGQFEVDTLTEGAVAAIFAVLAGIGLPYLARRNGGMTILLSAPLIAAVLASAARILPFSRRVSIYACPVLLIMALAGTDQIRSWLPRRGRIVQAGICAVLVAVPALILLLLIRFPDRREEARPVLEELRSRWREGDQIYVLPSARIAMDFYGEQLSIPKWRTGAGSSGDVRAQLKEVDSFRGHARVWIFYTHAVPCAQRVFRSYLESIGREVDRIEDPYGNQGKSEAAAHLYDLSDPERLRAADARSYPLPAHIPEHCGYPQDDHWSAARKRLLRIIGREGG